MDGFGGVAPAGSESSTPSIERILQAAREAAQLIPDAGLIPHTFAWQLKHGCLATAKADEPLFVLRAQDRSAPAAVDAWAANAQMQGVDLSKVKTAEHCANEMRRWDGDKKTPD